jgi:Protein of unknown function (DUF3606)
MHVASEVKCWTEHLGVTRDELQRAIEKVGACASSQQNNTPQHVDGGLGRVVYSSHGMVAIAQRTATAMAQVSSNAAISKASASSITVTAPRPIMVALSQRPSTPPQ